MGKPASSEDDFLYLFFPDTDEARQAGLASLRRLDSRRRRSRAKKRDKQMTEVETRDRWH
jgi:hypothetical protein